VIGVDATVRLVTECDGDALVRMLRRLSPSSVHRRFFSPLADVDAIARSLMASADAIVAVLAGEVIGIASYHARHDDPTVAEVAVLVEDGWQHHGLGRRLMRLLAKRATANGIVRFHADVLADNRDAIALVRRSNPAARAAFEYGVLTYDLPLVAA
jgi:GNAT superfamily N-acetyltransferase